MLAIKNFISMYTNIAKKTVRAYSVNIKNIIYFFMPSIIGLMINLFTFPIFSRNLSSYDFSVMGYFEAIGQIFLPIMNLSFFSYYMKDFFSRSEEENRSVRATLVSFLLVVNIGIVLLGLALIMLYFNFADVTFPLFPFGILSLGAIYFSIFIAFLGVEYKLKKEGLKFFSLQTANIILPTTFALVLVVVLHLGATGRMLGTLLSQFILGVFALRMMLERVKFDLKIIKGALAFGFPLILIALLDIPTTYIDRLILERQNDVDSFALYNIGRKMSGFLFALGTAIYQSFEPDFYKYVSEKKTKKFLMIMGGVFGFLLIINCTFLIFAEPIISLLTSNRYTDSYQFANIMIWSNFFLLLSYALTIILIVNNKSTLLLYIQLMIAVSGVTIFMLFINYWKFIGASYAMVLIHFLNCLLLIFFICLSSWKRRKNQEEEENC